MSALGKDQTVLRLTTSGSDTGDRVEIVFETPEEHRRARVRLPSELAPQDEEDLRWYLEDYPEWPEDPAPIIASRVERRLEVLGNELFRQLFDADAEARELWEAARGQLATTRIEIVAPESFRVPWEIVRDPATGRPLAIDARAFVRVPETVLRNGVPPPIPAGLPLRVLVAICRPGGDTDVPFRCVATHVVRSSRHGGRRVLELRVLRPPTFERLEGVLAEARDAGRPYHAVHFDGHGIYEDLKAQRRGKAASQPRGYLVFEGPGEGGGRQLVDGRRLGRVLTASGVALLLLNACRSAHAEAQRAPVRFDDEAQEAGAVARPRAWGSLAREAIDAGVPGVVAMRYNVYVATAAQLVAELYTALTQGCSLAEAVTRSRRGLFAEPLRSAGVEARPFQDWLVPLIYESTPSQSVEDDASGASEDAAAFVDPAELPAEPTAGFHGRDETLLALDRAFDRHCAVLLHGEAGGGKTTTAAEFTRWYVETGGHSGPVLFTSFESPRSLGQVLDQLAFCFAPRSDGFGNSQSSAVAWLQWSVAQRRQAVLDLMRRQPVFWIWDNVEPTAHPSAAAERQELAEFLRDAAGTRARFLLTSRGEEKAWLGDLVIRVALPAMESGQRFQFARALIEKRGGNTSDLTILAPLLSFSGGNPLALEVILGQASREAVEKPEDVESLLEKLRRGAVAFVEEADSGRALKASLSYGFDNAFEPGEDRILALLTMFQGFVDADVLVDMGDPREAWGLPGMAREREVFVALLDRAAEIGLLSRLGQGSYRVHPVLPWFFRRLFEQHHGRDEASRRVVERAWVEAMGRRSNKLFEAFARGELSRLHALRAEEANLLQARRLARRRGWWHRVTSAMQGLYGLYNHTGRSATWAILVAEVVPDFCDPQTDGPRPGRELRWGLIMGYRARLARQRGDLAHAQRLQEQLVDAQRAAASEALRRPIRELDHAARSELRSLGAALHELGQVRRELGRRDCLDAYMEAIELAADLGDRAGASACALNLGHAYEDLAGVRDLNQAETWYRRSLDVRPRQDRLGRAISLGSLGSVARERFREAREEGRPREELEELLHKAAQLYREDLEILPHDAIAHRAVAHVQLGNTYGDLGETNQALSHYREAIRLRERSGDAIEAASVRFNVARQLSEAGRLSDAETYAMSALKGFEACGERAAELVRKTRVLIEDVRDRRTLKVQTREKVESVLGSLDILRNLPFE